MDLSPGLDFETRIFCKPDAPRLLEEALTRPGYRVSTIALGTNTDPYQPAERDRRITRQILEVLADFSHPASIVTKSSLVERDADILEGMARKNLVRVTISVTSLDKALKRRLEPRTAGPARRLETIRTLTARGIPTGSLVAPVIPGLNDHEIENIVAAVAAAGADCAGYILLRLPWEVQPLFEDWLEAHYPMKASKVMNLVRSCRDGQAYDARFGHRMRGNGEYAGLIRRRFSKALRRSGLKYGESSALDTRRFSVPPRAGDQLALTL
jgi:DNA repair photolyase